MVVHKIIEKCTKAVQINVLLRKTHEKPPVISSIIEQQKGSLLSEPRMLIHYKQNQITNN